MVVWEIAKSKNKLLSWQHCRLPRHFSMSHQSPKPLPFFHSYSSRSKHVAASACNAGPHISDFPSTSLNPFPFQRPPAPIADTSARPPLLAVQAAQALQLFPWMSHNPAACSYSSWSKREAASACNTGPRMSFPHVTSNPFSFSVASSSHNRR